jgi:subtilase family serine protease
MSALLIVSTPGTSSVNSSGTLTADVWNHLAGTYDGTTLRIYVNGALAGTAPARDRRPWC